MYETLLRGNTPNNKLLQIVFKLIKQVKLNRIIINYCERYFLNLNPSNKLFCFYMFGNVNSSLLDYDMVFPPVHLKYENVLLPFFNDVKGYLSIRYGDYLKLPSKEEIEQNLHAESFVINTRLERNTVGKYD